MSQITARLSPGERRRFEKYALSLGLNGSSLARLLLQRELGGPIKRPVRFRGSEDGKLTAHSCSAEAVRLLKAHADAQGVSKAEAAKFIFQRELRERWLSKAIGWSRHRGRS